MPTGSAITGADCGTTASSAPHDAAGGGSTVGADLAAAAATACDAELASLENEVWGYSNWWEDTEVVAHYVNFKVSRFEVGPSFGLQLYSTQNDVVVIATGKTAIFKPVGHGAGLSIAINQDLAFSLPEVTRRQLSADSKETKRRLDMRAATEAEQAASRMKGSCHPFHGCLPVIKTSKVAFKSLASNRTSHAHRELGFFSALMTSGSFTMMQAGSF